MNGAICCIWLSIAARTVELQPLVSGAQVIGEPAGMLASPHEVPIATVLGLVTKQS
jgi:hypothetical protein